MVFGGSSWPDVESQRRFGAVFAKLTAAQVEAIGNDLSASRRRPGFNPAP